MKRNKSKNKGITLIALVITIIILLILAGIAISTLTGSNGLFVKAKDARNNTLNAKQEEEIRNGYNSVIASILGTQTKIQ